MGDMIACCPQEVCSDWGGEDRCVHSDNPIIGPTSTAVGMELLMLAIMFVVLFAFLLLRESSLLSRMFSFTKRSPPAVDPSTRDPAVVAEEARVASLVAKKATASQSLVVDHLSKEYGGKFVVSDISFAVQRSECFGLLGVNGAGKSTTFGECIRCSSN